MAVLLGKGGNADADSYAQQNAEKKDVVKETHVHG